MATPQQEAQRKLALIVETARAKAKTQEEFVRLVADECMLVEGGTYDRRAEVEAFAAQAWMPMNRRARRKNLSIMRRQS